MCGIIGYVGNKNAAPILIEGLKRLEYRGYDSAGIAVMSENGKVEIHKKKGKLSELIEKMDVYSIKGNTGIGHTRWATHGEPSDENAHPHRAGRVVVVHNGIIENYESLKKELQKMGRKFNSDTDTEIIAHLVEINLSNGRSYLDAVISALKRLRGTYAVLFMFLDKPDFLIGARNGSPLVVGKGENECVLASDPLALIPFVKKMVVMNDDEIVVAEKGNIRFLNLKKEENKKEYLDMSISLSAVEKGTYKHFLHKEIMEQVDGIANTILSTIEGSESQLEDCVCEIEKVSHIYLTACGTSYHACMIGALWLEEIAGIPAYPVLASEERHRKLSFKDNGALIAVSQSGETADTLFAVKKWREKKYPVIGICNVPFSSLSRESDKVLFTRAGPEISVASTKAFTAQLTVLFLLSIFTARKRGNISANRFKEFLRELKEVPSKVNWILEREEEMKELARLHQHYQNFLYLGRWLNYPVALEGALKLKEISYIHAEGYAAGEMKHGPIALIDKNMPVVFVAPHDRALSKIKGNIEEVKAREGRIIVVTDSPNIFKNLSDFTIRIPKANEILSPLLSVIPLQLLAYHIAVLRGTDVDQPRNLAKSVTVE
jgi:glucosamine--fructose-6-phosphate aminotransferase (isomerizing)